MAETKRDGVLFKWITRSGEPEQRSYEGRRTRNRIDEARTELEDELNRAGSRLKWSAFFARYQKIHLADLADASVKKRVRISRLFVEYLSNAGLGDIECADLSEDLALGLEEDMLATGVVAATVAGNMAVFWAILNWGADYKLLPRLHRPRKRRSKAERQRKSKAKGRALAMEEVERMIEAVQSNPLLPAAGKKKSKHVRQPGEAPDQIVRAIYAMMLMGLRLDECHMLRWEPTPEHHYLLCLAGRSPMLHLDSVQKSGEDEEIPLTGPAIEWLRSLGETEGFICRMKGGRGYHQTSSRLGVVIANAGKSAGVIVKQSVGAKKKPKHASAHDLRRTFSAYWLSRLSVKEVQVLTRHANTETLLSYYADSSIEALATKLRGANSESGGYLVDDDHRTNSGESRLTK